MANPTQYRKRPVRVVDDNARKRPPRPGEGQPSKFTEERRTSILNDLRAGLPASTACARAGISWPTYNDWLHRDGPEYVKFAEECERAFADAEALSLGRIRRAAQDDPRWDAWYLTHVHRTKYAERHVSEVRADVTQHAASLDLNEYTDEEQLALLELALEARRQGLRKREVSRGEGTD